MRVCNFIHTPLEKCLQLPYAESESCNTTYRELVGTLIYFMTCVWSDICYDIGYMSPYQENFCEMKMIVKRILRFLKRTKSLNLQFYNNKESDNIQIDFVDVDKPNHTNDRKSTSECI